jgi:hypothetical protein
MIRKAKLTFITGFLVLSVFIGWVEYKYIFKERLSLQEELIDSLKQKLQQKSSARAEPTVDVPKTGNATSLGDNSPAVTGSGNTFGGPKSPATPKK